MLRDILDLFKGLENEKLQEQECPGQPVLIVNVTLLHAKYAAAAELCKQCTCCVEVSDLCQQAEIS